VPELLDVRGMVPRPLAIEVEHQDIDGTVRITAFERGDGSDGVSRGGSSGRDVVPEADEAGLSRYRWRSIGGRGSSGRTGEEFVSDIAD
jgi:hypothetical protein